MGWFSREVRSWKRTNPLAAIGRARAGKPMSLKQIGQKLGKGERLVSTPLRHAYREIRKLKAEIKHLKNQIQQLKKINAAQKPMKGDQVNEGTYAYYQTGLKRILAITMKRQRLSTYTMPEIRAEVNGMLGTNVEFKGYGKRK